MAKKSTTGGKAGKNAATTGNRQADRVLRKVRMSFLAKFVVWLVVTAALAASMLFAPRIEAAIFPPAPAARTTEGELAIRFLDVGQGDCTLIRLPDQKTMIIDGGENDRAVSETIRAAIPEMFGDDFQVFDYCILTHTDADHCGSLDDVLNAYPARTVYRPNVISFTRIKDPADPENKRYIFDAFSDPAVAITRDDDRDDNEQFWWFDDAGRELTDGAAIVAAMETEIRDKVNSSSGMAGKSTGVYRDFLEAAYDSENKAKLGGEPRVIVSDGRRDDRPAGKALCDISGDADGDGADDYRVKFWSPLDASYRDWNDCSNILTLEFNGQTIMLTGDAEKGAEEEFVAAYAAQKSAFGVDLLKLGHHGSRTSSSEDFLELVLDADRSRVYTVVSCGLDNSYGHPHEETLARLRAFGIADDHVLRTDTLAADETAIPVTVDAAGLHVNGTITKPAAAVPTIRWWYIAAGAEALTVVVLFGIVGTKKTRKRSGRAA